MSTQEENKRELPESIDDFEKMEFLPDELLMGIFKYGFKYPSPIQSKTIHIINSGEDLIAQSQSGTGKTGAFTIGSLSRIDTKGNYPQVLMIANTRTLACQILKVVENISMDMMISCCLCVGKTNSGDNMRNAKRSHVLVGTPGRLCDLVQRGIFDGSKVKTLIVDESDVLLKEDFREEMIRIINNLGNSTQICLFSATFTREALEMTTQFTKNPYRITMEKEKLSLEKVKQYRIDAEEERNKFGILVDLFDKLCISQIIIFVNSQKIGTVLRDKLKKRNNEAELIHGKLNNTTREEILKEFRLANIKTLISTDVMCRGIDIDDLRIIINYDMAGDNETYIHRIGRSGRYGSEGIAINLCTNNDAYKIRIIERDYKISIDPMPDPVTINEFLTGMKMPKNKVLSSKNYKE
jgi:superfamily II DNA/RNA helicase